MSIPLKSIPPASASIEALMLAGQLLGVLSAALTGQVPGFEALRAACHIWGHPFDSLRQARSTVEAWMGAACGLGEPQRPERQVELMPTKLARQVESDLYSRLGVKAH